MTVFLSEATSEGHPRGARVQSVLVSSICLEIRFSNVFYVLSCTPNKSNSYIYTSAEKMREINLRYYIASGMGSTNHKLGRKSNKP